MNKIERMLQELCPNGVRYLSLGECIEIYTGIQFNKRDMSEVGTYPVLNGGINPSGFTEKYNEEKDTITISQGGASAGYVNWMDCKFWAGAHCFVVKPNNDILNNRYLYFLLKNSEQILMQAKHGAGIPGLNRDKVKNLIMPIPPLPIQEEIVRVLDHFTELTAELQAELQARQEQYEYCRNKLLTFNILPPTTSTEVRWMKMSEICSVYTGGEMPKNSIISDVKTELYKYPIYANGKDVYGYSNSFRIKEDSVCISSIGANAGTVFFKNGYFTPIIRLKVIVPLTNTINTKYLYYAISTLRIKTKGNGGIPNINANDIKKLLVPIPSLSEQQRIVSILDKFETLVNDLSQGLPAEIAAVQEQYEYYRNKLLTFKRIA